MTLYCGQCHCGAVGYEYHCNLAVEEWPIRSCQCDFCRHHNSQTTSLPDAKIDFKENQTGRLRRYRFGLRTADFLLCGTCGGYVGAMIETHDGPFGIINTRLLTPRPTDLQAPSPASYDTEDAAGRIARRRRRWSRVGMVP